MASLALGLTGAAIGSNFGNMGASIGWAIGSYIGASLFTDDINTYGPRLSDLKVTSSAYGASIPTVYGTYRIAGNVIWSAGLKETAHTQSVGGKGGPSQTHTSYTYSCSFAVGLCEGTITGIRKIWADGTLIYNKGDTATADELAVSNQIGITVYTGSEVQEPDSIIEADKGVGNVPAYRGLAYIVFEDLQLEKYGNRIPNITCEVVDSGAITSVVENILTELRDTPQGHSHTAFPAKPYFVSSDKVCFYAPQWHKNYPYYTKFVKHTYQSGVWSISDIPVTAPDVPPNGTTDSDTEYYIHKYHPLGSRLSDGIFASASGSFVHTYGVATGVSSFNGQRLSCKPDLGSTIRIPSTSKASCSDGTYVYSVDSYGGYIYKYDLNLNLIASVNAPPWGTLAIANARARVCDGYLYVAPTLSSGSSYLWRISLDLTAIEQVCYLSGFLGSYYNTEFFVSGNTITIAVGKTGSVGIYRYLLTEQISSNEVLMSSIISDICSKAAEVLPDVSSVLNTLKGYSRTGPMTAAAAIAPLLSTYSITATESDFQLKFEPKNGAVDISVDTAHLAATSDADKSKDPLNITRMSATELPRRITVAYASESRDYSNGVQYAQRVKDDG